MHIVAYRENHRKVPKITKIEDVAFFLSETKVHRLLRITIQKQREQRPDPTKERQGAKTRPNQRETGTGSKDPITLLRGALERRAKTRPKRDREQRPDYALARSARA